MPCLALARIGLLFTLLVALFGFAAPLHAKPKKMQAIQVAFQAALEQTKNAAPEAAREIWEEFVEANPRHRAARNNLAVALIKLGFYEQADNHLSFVLFTHPRFAGGWLNRGVARFGSEEIPTALGHTNRAIEFAEGDEFIEERAKAFYNRGWLLDEQGEYADAIESYEQALETRQGYPEALIGLAVTLAKSGKKEQAKQHLVTAIGLAESRPDLKGMALTNLALLEGVRPPTRSEITTPPWRGMLGDPSVRGSTRIVGLVAFIVLVLVALVVLGLTLSPDVGVGIRVVLGMLLGGIAFVVLWGFSEQVSLAVTTGFSALLVAVVRARR